MRHKAEWMGHPMRLELTLVGLLVKLANHYTTRGALSWRPDCIFEIHQLWQSGFSRVYSNSRCSCWFEPEIIKIGQSCHKMYSNNIVNFQVYTTILNPCTKKVWNHIECTTYIRILFSKQFCTLHLMVKLQSWSFEECRILLDCHYSLVYSALEW